LLHYLSFVEAKAEGKINTVIPMVIWKMYQKVKQSKNAKAECKNVTKIEMVI
jgi:hypothetical protein